MQLEDDLTFNMKKIFLILSLFITLSASAQIDSTEIHQKIIEWNLNPDNVDKRVPYFDDNGNLILSMIGIAMIGLFISKRREVNLKFNNIYNHKIN
jgi:hypothetical protein